MNVGIIGIGRMGQRHLEVFRMIPEVEIKGIYDINKKLAEIVSKKYSVPMYSSIDKILKISNLDAVSICTPNHLHKEPTLLSMEENLHVLVEKPFATNISDCDEMIKKSERKKVKLMIAHTHRFYPVNQKIKMILKNQELGEINTISCISLNPGFLKSKKKTASTTQWIMEKEARSGVFMTDAIHFVDLLRWWLEKEPEKLIKISEKIDENQIEERGMFALKFSDFLGGFITCNYRSPGVFQNKFHIMGANGILRANFEPNLVIGKEKWKEIPIKIPRIIKNESMKVNHIYAGFYNELQSFIECVKNDTEIPVSGEDGKKNLEIILRLYEK